MGKHSRSPSGSDSSEHRHEHKRRKPKKEKHKKDKSKKQKRSSPDRDKERLEAARAFLQQVLKQGGGGDAAAPAAAAVFAAEKQVANAATAADGGSGDKASDKAEQKRQRRRQERPPKPKPPGVGDITAADYFSRAAEFTAWLQEDRGLYFNELGGDEARSLFVEFIEDWNGGHLPLKYYKGLVLAPTKRTTHEWGFTARGGGGRGGSMSALMADQQQQQHERQLAAREAEGREKRRWRSDQKDLLDEMLPKATGREALVEKRMARREAAKAREDSPEMMRVTGGGDVMGGDDSFAAAKAREASYNARRNQRDLAKREQLTQKLSAAQEAEAAKMAQFRALLAHGPISIPKRQ